MLDDRTSLAKQVMAELKKYFGEKLCATTIPRNIRLAEAPSHGKPALLYDVRSRGSESYIRLAKEIIAHYFSQAPEAATAPAEVVAEGHVAAEPAAAEGPVVDPLAVEQAPQAAETQETPGSEEAPG